MRDMRNPENVLNSLSKHSGNLNYKFERLYRVLFNEGMFYVAYQNIYSKTGNMTAGVDGKTIDGMSIDRVEQLIDSLKNETYQPNPSKRTYIPKKNGKKRPLGIPSFNDKMVQEVVRMILEAIYEGSFEHTSHGFRPKRSCHTALIDIQKTFTAVKWFIEGDIKGFFDNINHDVLINILRERIADERFIRLIRKFLNAGYIEDWNFHNSYSGTPQGGIVSPILANIYLDKLDKFMKEYTEKFDKGKERKRTKQVVSLEGKRHRILKKLKVVKDKSERSELIRQYKAYQKEGLQYSDGDEMDMNYRKLKYVRYADDFLVGIIGSKKDAQQIKEDIKNFLADRLTLELSDEKTLVTHTERPAKFLGYEITVRKSNEQRRDKIGRLRRTFGKRVCLNVNMENTNRILGDKCITLWGQSYVTDYIGDIKYQISPLSFYQVNPVQTNVLYNKALEYADLSGDETVWDMYCGIGTISLFLAQKAKKVYGVEIVPQAIDDARHNAEINGITNAEFFVGKAEEVVPDIYKKGSDGSHADVVVVDPPRKGCDQVLLDTLVHMAPERIVYVSCDPATLARDLKRFVEEGTFSPVKITPVDLFPQTFHCETVVHLRRN